ncbi:hypothetical protein VTL71DRAFT_2362 [Oculimacula yallundae]|uniref:Uncharacterized protein n=1 Tax=Oculimacula yallundae TaxID=86028 RepID=A0ABR4CA10_9HELO
MSPKSTTLLLKRIRFDDKITEIPY